MRLGILFITLMFMISMDNSQAQPVVITPAGVKINVTDMSKALEFYRDKLGFTVTSGNQHSRLVWLTTANGAYKVALHLVNNLLPVGPFEAHATLTLQVNDLDSSIAILKNRGVNFGDNSKRKEGVGYAIFFKDPFGTSISMMHQTIIKTPWFAEPKIYNYGVTVPDMDNERAFYKALGFVERSEKYLPWDMPLGNADGTFGFMLHMRERIESIQYNSSDYEHVVMLFTTRYLDKAIKNLEGKIKFVQKNPVQSELGRYISFADAAGIISELVEEGSLK